MSGRVIVLIVLAGALVQCSMAHADQVCVVRGPVTYCTYHYHHPDRTVHVACKYVRVLWSCHASK